MYFEKVTASWKICIYTALESLPFPYAQFIVIWNICQWLTLKFAGQNELDAVKIYRSIKNERTATQCARFQLWGIYCTSSQETV